MLVSDQQFVNIHAHRKADDENEWVLRDLGHRLILSGQENSKNSFSAGIHPWRLDDLDLEESLNILKETLQNPQVLAVGECGIDKSIETSLERQIDAFKAQLKLAAHFSLPVIIHLVRSAQEIIALGKQMNPGVPMIIHGFRGGVQLANELVVNDYYVSFGKTLMHSEKNQEAFRKTNLNYIFLESDEADINIRDLYHFAAELKGLSLDSLMQHMAEKVNRLFYSKLNIS